MDAQLTDPVLMMIDLTKNTVGGVVNFLDLTFKDGTKARCRRLGRSGVELPAGYAEADIEKVGVPFDQTSGPSH